MAVTLAVRRGVALRRLVDMLALRRPAAGPAARVGGTYLPDHVERGRDGGLASRPEGVMNFAIAAAVFPVIFIGELPDKTMFASLVMSSRGRPWAVWLGAAGAFLVHVAIATTIGVGLFALLPQRAVDALVAVLFLAGAIYAFVAVGGDKARLVPPQAQAHPPGGTLALAGI